MTTYRVNNWNIYSVKDEYKRLVSVVELEAFSEKDALYKATELANNWNREETRENMKVNMMTCGKFIKTA